MDLQQHDVTFECDAPDCDYMIAASAHDPLFVEIVEQHQLMHDQQGMPFAPRWSSTRDWSPSLRYGRDRFPVEWYVAVVGFAVMVLLVAGAVVLS